MPLLYAELVKVMDVCKSYEWEVLFVNDDSCANTLPIIQDLRKKDNRISYVDLSRNFGKENTMLADFDYVTGDCLIITYNNYA